MTPVYIFVSLSMLAALVMLRLSDVTFIRVLAASGVMVGVPSLLVFGPFASIELQGEPGPLIFGVVALGSVGLIFVVASLLAAMIRVAVQIVRALRAKRATAAR